MTAPTTTEGPAAVVASAVFLALAGGWLGYRYFGSHPNLLASMDTALITTLGIAVCVTLAAAGHTWRATHPAPAREDEPDRWSLRLPVASALVATAGASFTFTLLVVTWRLAAPLLPAAGLAGAAAIAAAGFSLERYRLISHRTAIRTHIIQALYAPLGHRYPNPTVAAQVTWQPKTAVPQTITIRAQRPTNTRLTESDDHPALEDDKPSSSARLDPGVAIRRALRSHCGAHYRVSADPSGLRFTATHYVPEQLDDELADLTRKAREVFGATATVTGDTTAGFTVKHTIASKLTGEFRKRLAEQNLTELIGGTWRTKWDMQTSTVTFSPKPVLDKVIYPTPVPEVHSIADAVAHYRQTRFPYGVDLDMNPQEWDPLDAPHTLVGGKTGAGKTVYLRTKIMQASRRGWAIVIVDFKGGSFSDLVGWPNVHIISSDPFESIATIHRMYKLMNDRNARARWDQKQWDNNLPYLVVVDEAAQFKVVLTRLWNTQLKPKTGGGKEPPTLTELNELARLSRTARIHLVLGMQRPDHDLIDTESRDNFGNRVSVGPISRIAADMLFDDSYTGRFVPRIKGRGMSTGTHEEPRETQYYFSPAADTTRPEEVRVIEAMRPSHTLIPRYVPELPDDLSAAKWHDIADATWYPLSERPDLDPARVMRTVTHWSGDSTLGFESAADPTTQKIVVAANQLEAKDVLTIDGHRGEVDGIDVAADGTVTIMWQDEQDGRLCVSSAGPGSQFTVQRNSS